MAEELINANRLLMELRTFGYQEVEGFLANFDAVFEAGTPEERRRLVRTFVHRLELDPKEQEVRVEFYADLQVQSLGVRRGT